MKTIQLAIAVSALLIACSVSKDDSQREQEIQSLNLTRGDIALCGAGEFGNVSFALSCIEAVQSDFNLATALLHSFEYVEAEKVFAKVIDADPGCVMAYWGVAMTNFHPLWAPPTPEELAKGSKTIAIARSLDATSAKEEAYIEAVATIFDSWDKLEHKTRVQKFEQAAKAIYVKYPDDLEAAIFYALALRASADPTDKTFVKQKAAGAILTKAFIARPNHPGVAHYLIHNYDYPELAQLGLPAARKYASIASASAHAQHMPSHIFTRLGLWDEAIQSNTRSMDAAKCYAEKAGKVGHWDQELHGLDYVVYAYLQQGNDAEAKAQIDYLNGIEEVFPITFVNAYTFAVAPMRYALERRDWKQAASLQLRPAGFPWDKFMWEKSIFHYGKLMGHLHLKQLKEAQTEMDTLQKMHAGLERFNKTYEMNQVQIQITAAKAWMRYMEGKNGEALVLMQSASDMEDATEKHSVTPGEVLPAHELLGDLYLAMGKYNEAIQAYEGNLQRRPGRYNSIYGAAEAARTVGNKALAKKYFQQLVDLTQSAPEKRKEVKQAEVYLKQSI